MAKFSVGREDDGEGPSSPEQKRRRTLIEDEEDVNEEEEEEENEGSDGSKDGRDLVDLPSRDGSISVTLTDPDVLDCSICFEPLNIPVFQCENGHIACSSCCIKLGNKCHSCSWPIGYNRCRAIEKVLESVKISCRNTKYGCKETVSYSKKHVHEETCIYEPCSCPLPDCSFIGSSEQLSLHFSGKHPDSARHFRYNCLFPISLQMNQKFFILKEENEGVLFILNNGIELVGNAVTVSCIGPSSSKGGLLFDLIARKGRCSLRLQSFTECIPGRVEDPPSTGFLLVPSDFLDSCGQLKLELCIWNNNSCPAFIQRCENV